MNTKGFKRFLSDNKVWLLFVFSMAFFIFTMVHNLMHSALWGDEWAEYRISQKAIRNGELYANIIATFQPPLYNYFMHFWLRINQSLLWFRLFNVVIGCVSGTSLYLAVKKLADHRWAAASLACLATCYRWVYCTQECSEYALMLCFLFLTVWAYVEFVSEFKIRWLLLLIISAVCSIYSQYGSVFVAVPCLVGALVKYLFFDNKNKKHAIIVIVSYVISLGAFAVPLYLFFLQKQLANNEISENKVGLSMELLKDYPFTLGRILGYFYNLNGTDAWMFIGGALTIVLFVLSIIILVKKKVSFVQGSLVVILWSAYTLHYILVQLHIYAMVHPGQSAGFFGRYSYFYIPLALATAAVIFYKTTTLGIHARTVVKLICGACLLSMFLSFYALKENWYKAKDNIYAEIWVENRGYESTTLLFGVAEDGFDYYVSHSEGFDPSWLESQTYDVDLENLPDDFWAWRTNWGGNGWGETIAKARELGYDVTVYDDAGYDGQLAHCVKVS